MVSEAQVTAATTIGTDDDDRDGTVREEVGPDAAAGDDEDAEPAADGQRLALVDFDSDSRMTDRSRLGFAVGLDRLAHDPSWRGGLTNLILNDITFAGEVPANSLARRG